MILLHFDHYPITHGMIVTARLKLLPIGSKFRMWNVSSMCVSPPMDSLTAWWQTMMLAGRSTLRTSSSRHLAMQQSSENVFAVIRRIWGTWREEKGGKTLCHHSLKQWRKLQQWQWRKLGQWQQVPHHQQWRKLEQWQQVQHRHLTLEQWQVRCLPVRGICISTPATIEAALL